MQNYTTFEYMYRDAANYKAWDGVILAGILTQKDEKLIRQHFDEGEFFIAEQIGVPSLCMRLWQYSNGQPNDDDHAWHTAYNFRPTTNDDIARFTLWGTVEDFIARILTVRKWDTTLSPNYTAMQN